MEQRGRGLCPELPLLVLLRFDGASLRKAVRSCLRLMKHSSTQRCWKALECYVAHKGTTASPPPVSKSDDPDKVNRWGLDRRREEERDED